MLALMAPIHATISVALLLLCALLCRFVLEMMAGESEVMLGASASSSVIVWIGWRDEFVFGYIFGIALMTSSYDGGGSIGGTKIVH